MSRILEFLPIPVRSAKPRESGLTIVRDDGIGYNYAEDLLQTTAPYIDYMKMRHFFTLTAEDFSADMTLRKVRLYRSHDINVFPGGIVFEIAYTQDRYKQYFETIVQHGFNAVEISENIITLTASEQEKVVKTACDAGLKVLFEVGDKYPEAVQDLPLLVEEIQRLLAWGATKVIVERSYTDLLLGPNADKPTAKYIKDLINMVGLAPLTFELESTIHQAWFLQQFGPDVNIGPNIPMEMVLKLEPTRRTLSREGGYTWLMEKAK